MKVIYAQQAIPNNISKSIFLAGPSLRTEQTGISWRIKALQILEIIGYDGVVFVPEAETGNFTDFNYDLQILWETKCLRIADNILFFINGNLENGLLGLTTNAELGQWQDSGKCVLVTEETADSVRYQEWWAKELKVPAYHNMFDGIKYIDSIQVDCQRTDGERFVPQEIFLLEQFQSWYQSLKLNGNWLSDAKVLNTYRIPSNNKVFAFSLWVNVFIRNENRYKNNEFIFSRPDISSCVLYYPNENLLDSEIVLVSEFRSPVNNSEGKVYELPGGSSVKLGIDPKERIVEELEEETGFEPNIDKLNFEGERQICSTLLTHKNWLYSYCLDDLEYQKLKLNVGKIFGNIEDTERTELHIFKVSDILNMNYVDWSNI